MQDILEYVRLRQTIDRYLGPLCHGDRYTSFGRHFTKPEIMDRVVERVMEHIADGDIVVDMTCGANTFVPAIKKKAKENGGKVWSTHSDVNLDLWPCDLAARIRVEHTTCVEISLSGFMGPLV